MFDNRFRLPAVVILLIFVVPAGGWLAYSFLLTVLSYLFEILIGIYILIATLFFFKKAWALYAFMNTAGSRLEGGFALRMGKVILNLKLGGFSKLFSGVSAAFGLLADAIAWPAHVFSSVVTYLIAGHHARKATEAKPIAILGSMMLYKTVALNIQAAVMFAVSLAATLVAINTVSDSAVYNGTAWLTLSYANFLLIALFLSPVSFEQQFRQQPFTPVWQLVIFTAFIAGIYMSGFYLLSTLNLSNDDGALPSAVGGLVSRPSVSVLMSGEWWSASNVLQAFSSVLFASVLIQRIKGWKHFERRHEDKYAIAGLYLTQGNPQQAMIWLDQIESHDASSLSVLSVAQLFDGKIDKGFESLRSAIMLQTFDWPAKGRAEAAEFLSLQQLIVDFKVPVKFVELALNKFLENEQRPLLYFSVAGNFHISGRSGSIDVSGLFAEAVSEENLIIFKIGEGLRQNRLHNIRSLTDAMPVYVLGFASADRVAYEVLSIVANFSRGLNAESADHQLGAEKIELIEEKVSLCIAEEDVLGVALLYVLFASLALPLGYIFSDFQENLGRIVKDLEAFNKKFASGRQIESVLPGALQQIREMPTLSAVE